jgi:hypothetical protein
MTSRTYAEVIGLAEARAKADSEFAGVLDALIDAPTRPDGDLDRLAAREVNDRRMRAAVEEFCAAALPTSEVQRLLCLGTPQAVHRLRTRGRIVGKQVGNRTWFPAWQFSGGGLRPDLAQILALLLRWSDDPVAADRVMRLVRDDLGGSSVATRLDDPGWAEQAWTVLSELAG